LAGRNVGNPLVAAVFERNISMTPSRNWASISFRLLAFLTLGVLSVALVIQTGVWKYARFWTNANASPPSRPPGSIRNGTEPLSENTVGQEATPFWPQWRGPHRDDVSLEKGLLRTWPSGGPKLLWTFDNAGLGYSGPAIVGNRLYTLGAYAGNEYIYAIDAATGGELWSAEIGPVFINGWGDGPRSTPTVDGTRLYALGARGILTCVEVANGKKTWSVNFQNDLGGKLPGWGYTESPLVDGDRVVCTPGGAQGTLVALDKKTGKVIWRSTSLQDPAAYSSIIVAEVGGLRQYIQMTSQGVVGVAANDGRLLWRSDLARNGTAVIPTPIFRNGFAYVTSGYGAGCGLLKLTPEAQGTQAEKIYGNTVMKNQHGGVVLVGDHVYGYSDNRGWMCQTFQTGEMASESKAISRGSVTFADGQLYCYGEDEGTVVLVEAGPSGWTEHGRFELPRKTGQQRKSGQIWTHPVIANGRLYLRDQDLIFCYDLRDSK